MKARIVAAYGHQCLACASDATLLSAIERGRRHDVVVGDVVELIEPISEPAVIARIEDRSSLLFRADAHRTKALAANIDQMAIVYAPQPTYAQAFIWRALIAAQSADIAAIVILNKTDTLTPNDPAMATYRLLNELGYATLAISAKEQAQATQHTLKSVLKGKATLLVGQSGMGKSTLLNLLVPQAAARTQAFSARLNLGKHTTTASRWFDLPASDGGGAIIDSPGFQSFGLAHLSTTAIAGAMREFAPYLGHCRFSNCQHHQEPNCAIRAAVQAGSISAERYRFYKNLVQETEQAKANKQSNKKH
ncbi:MAG TPA: ribosome small subunit-dependent GTPase A [Burkholderiaceae bacterium]|nr:ribosome small subunit-dependent GTPase A [Burkholderiaceae bacterium]